MCLSQKKLISKLSPQHDIWIILIFDQACLVKMAGYWPIFFAMFMEQDTVEVHKYTPKK